MLTARLLVVMERLSLLALLFIGLGGCASDSRGYFVAEEAPPPDEIRKVLVVPMNFEATPPAHLVRGTEILQVKVAAYLRSTGRHVARARLPDVLRIWGELASASGGFLEEDGKTLREDRVEAARSELARHLADAYPADVIVMPTLLVREGYYMGQYLRWDGVTRPIPVDNAQTGWVEVHAIQGRGPGTSLRMTLYTRDGEKCFERHAGLEPILRFTMGGFGSAQGARVQGFARTDLFEDPAVLEETVALSLTPLIEPPLTSSE